MKTIRLIGVALYLMLGTQLLPAQTFNYFAGDSAGINTRSEYNVLIGYNAGRSRITGSLNTFVGYSAGYSNTAGEQNIFIGAEAGYANTFGGLNTFVGTVAGYRNTYGSFNTFLGNSAGNQNTEGNSNVFLGESAGYGNSTGSANVFVGRSTGGANTEGYANTFVGTAAGFNNTTGRENAFMGYQAGYTNTGNSNTFIGSQAGLFNATGSENAFLGGGAGESNTTGSSNAFLGYKAGKATTTGSSNLFVGRGAGFRNTSGSGNVAMGREAGSRNTTGRDNTFLGNYAGGTASLMNASAIGNRAYVTASNSLVLGSIGGQNGASAGVNVGIGMSAPAYQLHLSRNSAAKPGSSTWRVAADRRLQQSTTKFAEGLSVIEKIQPVWFQYAAGPGLPVTEKFVGVVAQDIQPVAPYTVGTFVQADEEGTQTKYLDFDASALTYLLINAVKELKQQNQNLEKRLATLEEQINKGAQSGSGNRTMSETTDGEKEGNTSQTYLWQNQPNPADGSTTIRYQLPAGAGRATLDFHASDGAQVLRIDLSQREAGEWTLPAQQLPTGTYTYSLVVTGQVIATKKLLIIR